MGGGGGGGGGRGRVVARARSAIVFAQTCQRAEELAETLRALGRRDVIALHSAMEQRRRAAALGKFRARARDAAVLVCTDVAQRGLDVPHVDLVVNYDAPRAPDDYVHRVGRTARAGRRGVAVTLVAQRDVRLVHAIEEYVAPAKLEECAAVRERDVLKLLNPVAKAARKAKQRLLERGFEDKLAERKARNQRQHGSRQAE